MSIPVVDYLPCDYQRYFQEILPLWREALRGNMQPLRGLIQSAGHFSLWPYLNCPLAPFQGDIKSMHQYIENSAPDLGRFLPSPQKITTLWQLFEPAILHMKKMPFTVSQWEITPVLHSALFYTFCCDLPIQQEPDQLREGRTVFIGNEDIPLWYEYIHRDLEMQALWKPFYQPAPVELESQWGVFRSKDTDVYMHAPRGCLFPYWEMSAPPSGFLTIEETQRLLTQTRLHEAPSLASIRGFCVRDAASMELSVDFRRIKQHERGKEHYYYNMSQRDIATGTLTYFSYCYLCSCDPENEQILYEELVAAHPEQMQNFQQRYYETLWELEDKIMRRVAFAASRGWGLIVIRD